MAGRDLFTGVWRITDTEAWGSEDLDLLGAPGIEFGSDGFGGFGFLAVEGDIDYVVIKYGGEWRVDFTWVGTDDGDPSSGRGFAWLDGEELKGEIFFHRGERSRFTAVRPRTRGT